MRVVVRFWGTSVVNSVNSGFETGPGTVKIARSWPPDELHLIWSGEPHR